MLAVLAFSAVSVATASAEVALWLANGNTITVLTLSDIEGLVVLENVIPLIGTIKIECSDIFDGSVGAEGEDQITEVLDLEAKKVGAPLSAEFVNCVVISTTNAALCELGELAEVWAENLPWTTQLELMTTVGQEILDLITAGTGGLPGYEVRCVITKSENLCEIPLSGIATNVAGGVLIVNLRTESETCTTGKGFVEGEGTALLTNGETLTVSDP